MYLSVPSGIERGEGWREGREGDGGMNGIKDGGGREAGREAGRQGGREGPGRKGGGRRKGGREGGREEG